MPGVNVALKSNLPGIVSQNLGSTDATGKYQFANAPGTCNYSIIPQLDTLPKLGLNTLDVLLTDWHINGIEPFTSPYQSIAADANRDGQLGALDLDAMSNLIVGNANNFPNNSAWRFVPAAHVFNSPLNPLGSVFPEKISTVCPMPSGENQHFVGVKTGDVDQSADLSSIAGGIDDRSGDLETATFKIVNQRFKAGDEVTATLISPELSTMLGFQFTIYANQNMLELLSAEPLLTEKMAVFPGQNSAALSWYTKQGESSGEREVLKLRFKALQNGSFKQAIQFNPSVAKDEAYSPARQTMNVALSFVQAVPEHIRAKLALVTPNPASGSVVGEFFLPTAGPATLTLRNSNGNVVASQSGTFEAGWNQAQIPVENQATGLYFLHLQSAFGNEVQRVMVVR